MRGLIFWPIMIILGLFMLFIGLGEWILAVLIPNWLIWSWWWGMEDDYNLQKYLADKDLKK